MQPIRAIPFLVLALFAFAPLGTSATNATDASAYRWALAFAPSGADVAADAHAAVVCALGDVNADGTFDLLVRLKDDSGATLRAIDGADPTHVLWESATDASATLDCAPDVAGDGVADVVVKTAQDAASSVPEGAPVSSEKAQATLHALDGATGKALVELAAEESSRGGETVAAAGSSATHVQLEPGAEDLLLFVTTESTEASAGLSLSDLLLSYTDASEKIQILDAAGKVQGVIEAATPGSDIVSHAAVVSNGTARILVLSTADGSPIDQAPAHVPTIASHALDGSLLWSVDLDATTDLVLLIPHAGDVDADGVEDLIVETMPNDLDLQGTSAVSVLSGADGKILTSLASEAGLLVALPLGDLTSDVAGDADAILVATQAKTGDTIKLQCLREGVECWTAELPATAVPVAGVTDSFTGALQGFADLTGDGVPDVATVAQEKGSAAIQVLSGATGGVAWTSALDAASDVAAIQLADGVDLAVMGEVASNGELALTMLDGVDGSVAWTSTAQLPAKLKDATAQLDAAQDASGALLVTVRSASDAASTELVYAIDAKTGASRFTGATLAGADAPDPFALVTAASSASPLAKVPAPGAPFVLLALAGSAIAVATLRRTKG